MYVGPKWSQKFSNTRETCTVYSNATSIVIFQLFDFLFSYPLFSPHLEWPIKALRLATTHKKKNKKHFYLYQLPIWENREQLLQLCKDFMKQ